MKTKNTSLIKTDYRKLVIAIKKKLKGVEKLDVDELRSHIIHLYEHEDVSGLIGDLADVDKIFKVLSDNCMWGYNNVTHLKSIADVFMEEDTALLDKITVYEEHLHAYRATTKIIDKIQSGEIKEYSGDEEFQSVMENPEKYTKSYRKRLSTKLFKGDKTGIFKLSMNSLEYVEKIWGYFSEEFEELSPLHSVLDTIEDGCIEVTWLIPSVSALGVLRHLHQAVDFFKRRFISNVILEGIIVYSESCGVANQKVRGSEVISVPNFHQPSYVPIRLSPSYISPTSTHTCIYIYVHVADN